MTIIEFLEARIQDADPNLALATERMLDIHHPTLKYRADYRLCEDRAAVEPVATGWDIPVELRIIADIYRDHPDFQVGWGIG